MKAASIRIIYFFCVYVGVFVLVRGKAAVS